MRIGAFDEEYRREVEESCFFSPTRTRTSSEAEQSNLEDGIVRRRITPTGLGTPSPNEKKACKTNPAFPLIEDFAGACYPDIIAKNLKKIEAGGKTWQGFETPSSEASASPDIGNSQRAARSPESSKQGTPIETGIHHEIPRKPLPNSDSSSNYSQDNNSDAAASAIGGKSWEGFEKQALERTKCRQKERMDLNLDLCRQMILPQETRAAMDKLTQEIDTGDNAREEQRASRLRDEAELNARLAAYDANRKASGINNVANGNAAPTGESDVKTEEDAEEAAIRKAFPKFTAVVSSASGDAWPDLK